MSFKEAEKVSKLTNEDQGKAHVLVLKKKDPQSGVYLWYKETEADDTFKPPGGIRVTNFAGRLLPVPRWQATREPKLHKVQKIASNPRLLVGGAVYGKTSSEQNNWHALARRIELLQVFFSKSIDYETVLMLMIHNMYDICLTESV